MDAEGPRVAAVSAHRTPAIGDLFARVAPYEVGGSGATFSPDRRYRYRLWRGWGNPEHRVCWVMLNPSMADEGDDDPTIRKCTGFSRKWGFGALDVVNLFALVSTDPMGLLTAADPVGPENDEAIRDAFHGAHRVVLAWGSHNAKVMRLVATRRSSIPTLIAAMCHDVGHLGLTQDGAPRHPSRIAYATRFELGGVP